MRPPSSAPALPAPAPPVTAPPGREPRVTRWLAGQSVPVFSLYAVAVAFTTYFCMYAFRKPFAVATFAGVHVGPLGLKSLLVISQVCGYALSKIVGIKFVSEMAPARRKWALFLLIAWAEGALVLFALAPPSGKIVALFLNGLPLGVVWGLVFGFLEGRRTSELLGAGLSSSYIVASGVVKSVGKLLLNHGVSESWMPATTGLLFLPVFVLAVWLLSLLPPPSPADQAARVARAPMHKHQRRAFVRRFFGGLALLTVVHVFMTAYRDFRDNFAAEIWTELGRASGSGIFTLTELPVALAVLTALALLYKVRDNRRGLLVTHALMLVGAITIGVVTLLFDFRVIDDVIWMTLVGLGLYLAYVPYGTVLFDRLIAAMGVVATAVFMIYVTDAAGYVGSVGILVYKETLYAGTGVLGFFRAFSYVTALLCSVCFTLSWVYFARKPRPETP